MHRIGVFNPVMDHDSQLFVDPKLLELGGPEFKDSRSELHSYFQETTDLIRLSKKEGDALWDGACKRVLSPERASAGLGFSKGGKAGNGIGPGLAKKIVGRIHEILPHVSYKPNIFELIGVFEKGVGCDRLSDMLIHILAWRFYAYTERVAEQLGIHQVKQVVLQTPAGSRSFSCPCFTQKEGPVLLVPKAVLQPLPIAADIGEALKLADLNDQTRTELSAMWSQALKTGREPAKTALQHFLFTRPQIFREVLSGYESADAQPYDFEKDSRNVSDFKALAKEIVGLVPPPSEQTSPADRVEAVLDRIVADLKKLIEENRLSDLLFDDNGKPRKEAMSQKLIYAVADIYGRLFNVDVSKEPNAGNGAADFKLSAGQTGRLLIEVKLSTHKRIREAYYHQIPAYAKSEGVKRLILMVIQVDDSTGQLDELRAVIRGSAERPIQLEVIDARRRLSASKRS